MELGITLSCHRRGCWAYKCSYRARERRRADKSCPQRLRRRKSIINQRRPARAIAHRRRAKSLLRIDIAQMRRHCGRRLLNGATFSALRPLGDE